MLFRSQDMSVSGMVNKIEDTFWQMERRITLTLFVDQNAFYPAEFDSFKQEYKINTNQKFPNKYSKSARVVQGTSSTAELFNELMIATNTDEETDTEADTDKDTDTDANTDKESD